MKNKISKLLIAIPLVLVLTGCSFINDIINGGNSNTYSYKQVDKKIKDLEIDKNKQTDFNVGSDFVKPKVIATYEDGTTEDVTDKCEFTGYNMNVTGKQTVTVKYSNWTISYDITISEGSIGKTAKKIDYLMVIKVIILQVIHLLNQKLSRHLLMIQKKMSLNIVPLKYLI